MHTRSLGHLGTSDVGGYTRGMGSPLDDTKDAARRAHLARWEAVEAARARELAEMTEERAMEIIRSLQLFAPVPPDPLNGMGLVEQQAIFHGRRPR